MLKYGVNLDDSYKPMCEQAYQLFINLYKNPQMTKVKDKEQQSIYMTKTSCLLINECRYLIAIVPKDTATLGAHRNLSDLPWTNFQTRLLKGKYNCAICPVSAVKSAPIPLELVQRTEKYTEYKNSEYGVSVSLVTY